MAAEKHKVVVDAHGPHVCGCGFGIDDRLVQLVLESGRLVLGREYVRSDAKQCRSGQR